MSRDYKRPLSAPSAAPRMPAWSLLLAGVLLGLFLAFVVYLAGLPAPDDLPSLSLPKPTLELKKPAPKSEQPAQTTPPKKPTFEFYSILPELEVIVPEPEPRRTPPDTEPGAPTDRPALPDAPAMPGATYFLQAGSFRNTSEADRMKASLTLLGLDVVVQTVSVDGTRWHRVRVGPYRDGSSLNQARRRLHDNDIDYMTLRASNPG